MYCLCHPHGGFQKVVCVLGYGVPPTYKVGGQLIVNDQRINPMPVITGAAQYPENILEKLSSKVNTTSVDALALATEAGSIKAVNVVLIGVMAKNTDIPYDVWVETIRTTVPPKFLDINLKAFDLGYHVQ